jgi:hypothetical protein
VLAQAKAGSTRVVVTNWSADFDGLSPIKRADDRTLMT